MPPLATAALEPTVQHLPQFVHVVQQPTFTRRLASLAALTVYYWPRGRPRQPLGAARTRFAACGLICSQATKVLAILAPWVAVG